MSEARARKFIVYLVGVGTLIGIIAKFIQGTPW